MTTYWQYDNTLYEQETEDYEFYKRMHFNFLKLLSFPSYSMLFMLFNVTFISI